MGFDAYTTFLYSLFGTVYSELVVGDLMGPNVRNTVYVHSFWNYIYTHVPLSFGNVLPMIKLFMLS